MGLNNQTINLRLNRKHYPIERGKHESSYGSAQWGGTLLAPFVT